MFSEFKEISLLSMPNSEIFLIKDDKESVKLSIFEEPTLRNEDKCYAAMASKVPELHEGKEEFEIEKKEEKREATVPSDECESVRPSLGEFKVQEDDDGFKTPTSLDHKVPVIKQCPPAPRKPKPSMKRKVSQNVRTSLQLDLSKEVESLFPPSLLFDFHCKIKKARPLRDDEERLKL
ncbi:hypothetical protein RGQ29_026368 [Quercus rubra]|uniref:Uncharacterized protein n=1 Tax=Quercus rubra TaxID=3512 RepID=A0AAN7F1U8_QUERU|nr:hypothetical protein RGQ29_026368 [Quercus rubra]